MKYIYLKTNHELINHSRLRYVIEFINQHPLWPDEFMITTDGIVSEYHLCIEYLSKRTDDKNYHIPSSGKLFTAGKRLNTSSLHSGQYHYNEFTLFSVEENRMNEAFLIEYAFGFDLLETIFFHVSRYEEYYLNGDDCDFRGMLEEQKHFLVRENLEQIPVVDHIVYCLAHSLGLNPTKLKSKKSMSHDIDHIKKYGSFSKFLRLQGGVVKRLNWSKLFVQARQYFTNTNPYNTFEELLISDDMSKYIFYLMGGISKYDVVADIRDEVFLNSFLLAKKNGYQIGIHPGFDSTYSVDQICEEKKRLEKVIGEDIHISRNHFLRFLFPATLENLECAGITMDHSLGYRSRIGFRCGTGFPYKIYNVDREMITDIKVHPLIIMDQCLISTAISTHQDIEVIHDKFVGKNEYLTMISYNFHNSIFDFAEMRGFELKTLYQKIKHR